MNKHVLLTFAAAIFLVTAQAQDQVPTTIPYQGLIEVDGEPFTGTGRFYFMLVSKNPLTNTPKTASATVTSRVDGEIDRIILNSRGSGYTSVPTVTISGGGGFGAAASAFISSRGLVTAITITDSGTGYTSSPTATITAPQPAEKALWTNETDSPSSLSRPSQFESIPVVAGNYSLRLGDPDIMPGISGSNVFQPDVFLRIWFDDGSNGIQQLSPDQPLGSTPFSLTAQTVIAPDSSATGFRSTAMGSRTTASGFYSTAMGDSTTASGFFSTAMGQLTTASGGVATAMGERTTASGVRSTAMGNGTTASGDESTAMGNSTTASGKNSTAMGNGTTASGLNSTAIGFLTTASGDSATAMGFFTTASANSATAMGRNTTASGLDSTAMGFLTTASGDFSTAMGADTIAPSFSETTVGSYNTIYTPVSNLLSNPIDRLFVIGNGTSNGNRSDALIVEKSGQAFFKADPGAIDGSLTTDYAAVIENTDATEGGDALALKVQTVNPTSASNFLAFFDGDDTVLGEIDGNGSGGVRFQSTGADYAEYLPALDPDEELEAGDLVAVRSGKITRDTTSFDQLMVISTNPIVVGNQPADSTGFHKVAFIGQVPVKVSGPVRSGDYLLASGQNDGTAVAKPAAEIRASDRSRIIGRAWDSSDAAGEKLINAAVGLDLGVALVSEIKSLNEEVEQLRSQQSRFNERLQKLEGPGNE
ncbi:MAG: hypothetical protein AAGJ81_13575 [Verrucomicrobiota bacterium]